MPDVGLVAIWKPPNWCFAWSNSTSAINALLLTSAAGLCQPNPFWDRFSSVPRTVSLPDDEEFERPREKSPILGIFFWCFCFENYLKLITSEPCYEGYLIYVLHHSAEFMIESRLSRCSTRHRASIAKLGATLAGSEGRYGGGAGIL